MICQRPGCNNAVPSGRRKYCCAECGKIVNRRSSADEDLARYSALLRKRSTRMALRTCLTCSKRFLSEGPWNRICSTCSNRNGLVASRAANSSVGDAVVSDVCAEYLEEV